MLNLSDLIKEPGVYAIVGGAGSGKSSLAYQMATAYSRTQTMGMPPLVIISIDDYFIGTSDYRKRLLASKAPNWDQYKDACNQMNWWDWEEIFGMTIKERGSCAYPHVLIEGALLGPEPLWALCDKIIYVNTPSAQRLANLCIRDSHKRSGLELAHRFLITEYSEQIHYRQLLKYASDSGKLIICNNKGELDFSVENQYTLYLPKEV